MHYTLEELLPVVAKLTERYTSKDASSISYEMAEQLMGAVLYCVKELETSAGTTASRQILAKEMDIELVYRTGYEAVLMKVMKTKKLYEKIIVGFESYGNRALEDTISKGMPEFFLHYDARYCPQDHILTLDYPTIKPIGKRTGVDAIYYYLSCIRLEQLFLSAFRRAYIEETMAVLCPDYKDMFMNLCSGVLRMTLARMLIGTKTGDDAIWKHDLERFLELTADKTKEEREQMLCEALQKLLVQRGFERADSLYQYLKTDFKDSNLTM